jgi:choline dehydrogenase-like flavoprotein
MRKTFAAIIEAMGGTPDHPSGPSKRAKAALGFDRSPKSDEIDGSMIRTAGRAFHEVGGARMGSDPSKSVTNQWSRTHDVPNLVLTDGACFATSAHKNPTLTIMALSWRAAANLASEMKNGGL